MDCVVDAGCIASRGTLSAAIAVAIAADDGFDAAAARRVGPIGPGLGDVPSRSPAQLAAGGSQPSDSILTQPRIVRDRRG